MGYVPMDSASLSGLAFAFMETKKARRMVVCYVDGFNLYHAILALRKPHLKPVNLWTLIESLLKPEEALVAVKYFSAYAKWDAGKYKRHRGYVKDLEATGVTAVMAHFKHKDKRCYTCGATWVEHEEKETDVRLALEILKDATDDAFDRAYLLSADSDLVPVVQTIRERHPEKGILILTPPRRFSSARDLRAAGHASLELTPGRIAKHLFDSYG